MKGKLALLFLPILLLSSCGSSRKAIEVKERQPQHINDKYRNFYQIFPISYADSNGDGKGDLQGIVDKFDYIKSINMNGLWLTPVHPSPTYHKYDVTDYKAIDPVFGSIDDYDKLVKKCHDNDMTIILDLVFNHSSYNHPWFTACMNAHINGDKTNKYYNYYVVERYTGSVPDGYSRYQSSAWVYECRFWEGMPDFNLQGILDGSNTNLINDFKDIMQFWLVDHKVDGFRLDACTSFFTGDTDKNIAFMNWIKAESKALKADSYIIGEVLESSATYSKYYKGGDTDSYFAFDDSGKLGNAIYQSIISESINSVNKYINNDIKHANGHVPAPLLGNHDIGRAYKVDVKDNKFVHALLSIANGATFEYYGDEVSMASVGKKDEDFRQPFPWGDKYTCQPVSGSTYGSDEEKYPQGTMAAQEHDEKSHLNYVRKAYKYRLENPELARGTSEIFNQTEDGCAGILKREYNGSTVYVAINLSATLEEKVDIKDLKQLAVVGDLSIDESPYYSGDSLVMPPYSLIILH